MRFQDSGRRDLISIYIMFPLGSRNITAHSALLQLQDPSQFLTSHCGASNVGQYRTFPADSYYYKIGSLYHVPCHFISSSLPRSSRRFSGNVRSRMDRESIRGGPSIQRPQSSPKPPHLVQFNISLIVMASQLNHITTLPLVCDDHWS